MASSSAHCLQAFNFGHKMYFEQDVTAGAPAKSTAGELSSSSGKKKRRGGSGGVEGARPPRCQVEGCKVDLSDAKRYYSRHKVCPFHSKSSKVFLFGLHQRFCQQCSRFHQLTEFDKEKRSCRRRLAGHNERRRKLQPSSLLISPYARFSPAVFDNCGRVGGFLMEFAAGHKPTLRNELPAPTSMEQAAGNQSSIPPWQLNLQTPEFLSRGWMGRLNSFGPGNPPRECFAGTADTSCALSLLSNQAWGLRNTPPALGVNNFCFGGTSTTQIAASSHGPPIPFHHLSNVSGSFKGIELGNCLRDEVVPRPSEDQISLFRGELPGEVGAPQSNRRQYVDQLLKPVSPQLMHWSL